MAKPLIRTWRTANGLILRNGVSARSFSRLTPEALAEAKKTLAEWTDGRAEIVEGRNHGK